MFIDILMLCLCGAVLWYIFFQKKLFEDELPSLRRINSKEFEWTIPKFSTKLMKKYPTLAAMDFDFESLTWNGIIEYKDGDILFSLHSNKYRMTNSVLKFYLSIATVNPKGLDLFYCNNIDIYHFNVEKYKKKCWLGPSRDYCLKNKHLMFPNDVLTLFIRISNYPLPFGNKAKNHLGYSKNYIESTEEVGMERGTYLDYKNLNNLSENFKDLFLDKKDTDVEIIVRNVNLKAHRAILKARSSVISMLSKNETKIRIDDCNPKDFVTFLHFLYSGRVDNLDTDNAIPVYIIADKYKVPDLKEVCSKYIVCTLTVNSVSNVISLALKYQDDNLLMDATNFFLKNAVKIFPTPEWQTFLKQNPTKANELVIKSYSNKSS